MRPAARRDVLDARAEPDQRFPRNHSCDRLWRRSGDGLRPLVAKGLPPKAHARASAPGGAHTRRSRPSLVRRPNAGARASAERDSVVGDRASSEAHQAAIRYAETLTRAAENDPNAAL